MRVGSLCTGYGGLEMGIEQAFGPIDLVFVSDIDKNVSKLLTHHHPDTPNLSDLTKVNWEQQQPVDLLCAGYPCQPFSTAGLRKGTEDERAIFGYIADAISVLRPERILLENVAGHLTLGGVGVIAEITRLGYECCWGIVRASDAGAAHRRARLFIWAQPANARSHGRYKTATSESRQRQIRSSRHDREASYGEFTADPNGERLQGHFQQRPARPTTNVSSWQQARYRHFTQSDSPSDIFFGPYTKAIRRWERIMGRPVPYPVDDKGIEPVFVEWMMGLPEGHVTGLGMSRAAELKMLGNGVVPQQAALALHYLTQERTQYAA